MNARKGLLLVMICVVLLTVFVLLFSSDSFFKSEHKIFIYKIWDTFSNVLIENGPLLFVAIIILPAFILPVSPLLAFAGIWGESQSLLLSASLGTLSLSLNCCWTYWLARICGMSFVNRLMGLFKIKPVKIPQSENINFVNWSLILRLTPGIPFIFSNYILGAIKMPFYQYLLISVPILAVSSFGYIFAAAGLISGNLLNLFAGLSLIVVVIVVGKVIIKKKKNAI